MPICKNCGGEYDDSLAKCPYCGTMHKAGAYRKFRKKIADLIDSLLGLKEEVEHSVSRNIFFSLLKAVLTVCIILALALGVSFFYNTNYYNDRKYDEERYADILWEEENLEKLNRAFAERDFKTVESLIYENTRVTYSWEHYDAYLLLKAYDNISSNESFGEYYLRDSLYFLFFPEYYGNTDKLNEEDAREYESDREELLNVLAQKGYSESELHNIYDRCSDSYGYLDSSDLKKYLKAGDSVDRRNI